MSAKRLVSVPGVPHSERTLLAHAVFYGAPLTVSPTAIEKPALRLLAEVVAELQRGDEAHDRAAITTALQRHRVELGELRITPEALIEDLAEATEPANLSWHREQVLRTAQARALQQLFARRVSDVARDADIADTIERTKLELDSIAAIGVPPAPVATCAASISIAPVEWLWRERIAAGMLSVLDGDPGLGKSTIVADLAARITRGRALPGDDAPTSPAGVILISFEEAPSQVMVPRLLAAKADPSKIHIWNTDERHFDLVNSLSVLEKLIVEHGVRLVVIDPLMAALPVELNAHRDQDVRSVLAPVAGLAQRTGAAILLVRHLNKSGGGGAVYRGGGSIGIIGAARCGLALGKDPDSDGENDDGRRVLAMSKCNVGRMAPAIRLRLVPAPSPAPGVEVARIEWGGTAKVSADELVAPREEHGVLARATELLRDVMKDGPVLASEAHAALEANGVSQRTEARAKEKLGIVAKREGVKGKWWWYTPDQLPPSHSAKEAQ